MMMMILQGSRNVYGPGVAASHCLDLVEGVALRWRTTWRHGSRCRSRRRGASGVWIIIVVVVGRVWRRWRRSWRRKRSRRSRHNWLLGFGAHCTDIVVLPVTSAATATVFVVQTEIVYFLRNPAHSPGPGIDRHHRRRCRWWLLGSRGACC